MAQTEEAVKVEEKAEDKQEQDPKMSAQAVEFSEARQTATTGAGGSIDILLDMSVPVTVAIGQTQISVRRLLQLGPGSVLQLDKSIDAPADLYLKDSKFATGTIVVVDDRFAVRIKRILGLGDSAEKEDEV
jgi:flagellar motor switch protein FliN/FliY